MKKTFLIGWKDVTIAFRDRAALILMLAAPFVLTLGMGFITGRFFGGANTGISNIPVVLVNLDNGQLGDALVEAFQSEDLAELITASSVENANLARQQVDEDLIAAAIVIPAGFTDSILLGEEQPASNEVVQIQVITNPTRQTSAGVVKAIVDSFINQLEVGRVSGQVAVTQLIASGLIPPEQAIEIGSQIGKQQAMEAGEVSAFRLVKTSQTEEPVEFDILAFMAPGMALLFLMFTVSNGGRSLLMERNQGTLPRLLITPSNTVQVLGGKVLGIYLTGVAQMLILILASTLLFQLDWGDPLGVMGLVLAAVAGATGWGMLITSLAKSPGQVSAIGSAIMLTFGILGGSFISLEMMPNWVQQISKITPNAWGIDGFTTLALGGALNDIMQPIVALLVMGVILFCMAVLIFSRRGIMQK